MKKNKQIIKCCSIKDQMQENQNANFSSNKVLGSIFSSLLPADANKAKDKALHGLYCKTESNIIVQQKAESEKLEDMVGNNPFVRKMLKNRLQKSERVLKKYHDPQSPGVMAPLQEKEGDIMTLKQIKKKNIMEKKSRNMKLSFILEGTNFQTI